MRYSSYQLLPVTTAARERAYSQKMILAEIHLTESALDQIGTAAFVIYMRFKRLLRNCYG